MINNEMLTGLCSQHVILFDTHHRLHQQAANAFLALQQAAKMAGFNLQAASAFRDFARQQQIWNDKFYGKRPVLDHNSQLIDVEKLDIAQRCHAILRWSALPGASRHHWGSDLDIYDANLLPKGQALQLTTAEYTNTGYFAPLTEWLTENMQDHDFYRPFAQERGGVASEPWHLSYAPLAIQLQSRLNPEVVIHAWMKQKIAGKTWLIDHLDAIFKQYIHNIDLPA